MDLPLPVLDQLGKDKLPAGLSFPTWLVLDMQGRYPARSPKNPLQQALTRTDSLESFDRKIDALRSAPWLHGVLVRIGDLSVETATAWHLMRSLRRLSQDKRTVAYANQLDMVSTLVASGAREITLPESADLMLTGFTSEVTFFGAFLRKNGVEVENASRGEYKSALARFTQDRMDEFDRAQRDALLASAEQTWVREVAASRKVSEDAVRGWLRAGITSATQARDSGLIDSVAYEDELYGPGTRPLSSVAGVLKPPKPKPAGGRVAVVNLVGTIVTGRSRSNPLPLFGGVQAGADSVVSALRRAHRDPHTRAIVLYVNSGGGSALASDLMWREVARSIKPVVAVMGDVAASGGYYAVTHARRIVAAPSTITGSIGVATGKLVLRQLNERLGFGVDRVSRSAYPGLQSSSEPWSESERELIDRSVTEVYDRFLSRVAQGRNLSVERANELGRGRVWSGEDALRLGLVDELGDMGTGIERACELAGLPYDAPVWTVEPSRKLELPDLAQPAVGIAEALIPADFLRERALTWLDASWTVKSR